jgi:hypothetical protein
MGWKPQLAERGRGFIPAPAAGKMPQKARRTANEIIIFGLKPLAFALTSPQVLSGQKRKSLERYVETKPDRIDDAKPDAGTNTPIAPGSRA